MSLLTLVYALCSLGMLLISSKSKDVQIKQLQQEKDHWLKNEFIREEARIIIEFRNALYNAENSIFFFFPKLMQPQTIHSTDKSFIHTPETIPFQEYCKHYDLVNKVSSLYDKNRLTLNKFGIHSQMIYIWAILDTHVWLTGNDFEFTEISCSDNSRTYQMSEYSKIATAFTTSLYFREHSTVERLPKNFELDAKSQINRYLSELNEKVRQMADILEQTVADKKNVRETIERRTYPSSDLLTQIVKK